MALGASRARVLAMVYGRVGWMLAGGVAVGIAGTMLARKLIASVVETLRGARGRAIAANQTVLVSVNGERHVLSIAGGQTLQFPPALGVTAAAGPTGDPVTTLVGIRFAPDGSSSGGRIVLADGKRRTQIGVDWLTGRVSVADAP